MSEREDRYKQAKEAINEQLKARRPYTIEPDEVEYDDKQRIIRLMLYGAEIVLVDNGRWFIQDTSGG